MIISLYFVSISILIIFDKKSQRLISHLINNSRVNTNSSIFLLLGNKNQLKHPLIQFHFDILEDKNINFFKL